MPMPSNSASSQGGQSYQTPVINPYQMMQNQATTGYLTNTALPMLGGAATTATDVYNKALGGVNQAGTSLANYANTGSSILGQGGAQNFQAGSQGLQSLFSPDYEQQQLNASVIPAQQQYQQNLAGQQAGFGGAGQLGSARSAIAQNALALQTNQQQQQAAANTANQVAQQRAAAAGQLMQGGQSALTAGGALNQLGLTAAGAPMNLAQQYSGIAAQLAGAGGQPNFTGTNGMVTTSGTNATSAGIKI
jgi:hypothetical protein